MRLLAIFLCCLVAGCVVYRDDGQPQRTTSMPEITLDQPRESHWLNPLAQIDSARRVAAPAGIDIRQALYFAETAGDEPSLLLRLRDYSTAGDGKPDAQSLFLLHLSEGTSTEQEIPADMVPISILGSPDRQAWIHRL